MTLPGRNDPCPCGSGRKFKRCCGSAARSEIDITDDDRVSAYEVLDRMSRAPRFAKDLDAAAFRMTEGPLPSPLDDPDDEVNTGRFLDWFSFDVVLHTGRTLAAETLASRSGELTPGARRLIADLEHSPLRMLQVRTVFFGGAAFLAVDLLEPATTYRIHAGWFDVERHDVIIARVVRRGAWFEIEGDPAVSLPVEKRKLVRALRHARREVVKTEPSPQMTRMVEGAILVRLMSAIDAEDDGSVLETIESDPVSDATAHFRVHDRDALLGALRAATDFEAEDTAPDPSTLTFRWLEERAPTRHALGLVTVERDALHVQTFSPQRAERARAQILELAGSCVVFERIENGVSSHSHSDTLTDRQRSRA
jgi:SEC-C motif